MSNEIRVEYVTCEGFFCEKTFVDNLVEARNFAQNQADLGGQEIFILDSNDNVFSVY